MNDLEDRPSMRSPDSPPTAGIPPGQRLRQRIARLVLAQFFLTLLGQLVWVALDWQLLGAAMVYLPILATGIGTLWFSVRHAHSHGGSRRVLGYVGALAGAVLLPAAVFVLDMVILMLF